MTTISTCCLALFAIFSSLWLTLAIAPEDGGRIEFEYHNYDQLTLSLTRLRTDYPALTHLYTIGQSVEGRELWVLAIAGEDPQKHVLGRPETKYVGNMHGDEVIGREMLLHFAEWLLVNYRRDDEVTQFLDNTRLHILVSMNPDGFEVAQQRDDCRSFTGRNNDLGFDLNRNFPDYWEPNQYEIQPETRAIMNWVEGQQFVLSANLHGGTLVANYAYDNLDPEIKKNKTSMYSKSPDDDVFRYLATVYSFNHRKMHIYNETTCGGSSGFQDGITNGAEWYIVVGGMQDYNNLFAGCMEITLEISCCMYPNPAELPEFWEDNRDALMEYIKQVHRGVKGIVRNEDGVALEGAEVTVVERDVTYHTTNEGEYWRILMPGTYELQVVKDGYHPQTKTIQVNNYVYNVRQVDFTMVRVDEDGSATPSTPVSILTILTALMLLLL